LTPRRQWRTFTGVRRAVVIFALVAAAGCAHYQVRRHPGRPTGTCPGACAHYVDCKGSPQDDRLYATCVDECREIYEDPQVLVEYERLRCDDAVAFIEGESGRPPGSLAAE
jgi:hypothetical protein